MKQNSHKKTITICSSAAFFKEVLEFEKKLLELGFKVLVPCTARQMKKEGNFNDSDFKPWFKDSSAYKRKTLLMRDHFKKVVNADAILVVNLRKHEVDGYIGGNTLMEIALAFHLRKPIFVLNEVPSDFFLYEEIAGVNPVILNGNLNLIK
jgi:nucleoside 2-deoxyribosyltransferase